jgi:hypothetical protein
MWAWWSENRTGRLDGVSVQLIAHDPDTGVQEAGTMWTVQRASLTLRCALHTHPMGWELRASVGTEFLRSRVCREPAEVFKVAEQWRAEAQSKGWAEPPA